MNEMGVSARAKRRRLSQPPVTCCLGFEEFYIYIIYTPNLGLVIAVFDWEREQGRFRRSTKGVRGSTEGARESSKEVRTLAPRIRRGAAQRS